MASASGGGMQSGEPVEPTRSHTINWRRFAVMASAVITGVAVIRLIADHLGVPRGTPASKLVAVASNFFVYMVMGLSLPAIVSGITPRPLWRRLLVLIPIGALASLLSYAMMRDAT